MLLTHNVAGSSDPLDLLLARASEDWIWQVDPVDLPASSLPMSADLAEMAIALRTALTTLKQCEQQPLTLLLVIANPIGFLASFCTACHLGLRVFLGNPDWSEAELEGVIRGLQPELILGPRRLPVSLRNIEQIPQVFHRQTKVFHRFGLLWKTYGKHPKPLPREGWLEKKRSPDGSLVENSRICIATGGSSGRLRFAQHSWRTLEASVKGLLRSELTPEPGSIHSFCVLPLYHVSGLMQFVRSLTSGGYCAIASSQSLKLSFTSMTDSLPRSIKGAQKIQQTNIGLDSFWISLVPTQLQRLLQDPAKTQWLQQFQMVLLGGAPAWPSLLKAAKAANIALAPTYGMTETASQIVTLAPGAFGAGKSGCGRVLPHASVTVCDDQGQVLPTGVVGQIRVRSRALAAGYWYVSAGDRACPEPTRFEPLPEDAAGPYLATDDLGWLDAEGYLHLVGRSSDKIITGGENVFPAEVEAAIRATGLVADVAVMGVADAEWGERLVAVYVPAGSNANIPLQQALQLALQTQLSPPKRPKTWLAVTALPRNAQGKLNRLALRALIPEQV